MKQFLFDFFDGDKSGELTKGEIAHIVKHINRVITDVYGDGIFHYMFYSHLFCHYLSRHS
jgi:Ca2+-binding EF-hand superfamily protein